MNRILIAILFAAWSAVGMGQAAVTWTLDLNGEPPSADGIFLVGGFNDWTIGVDQLVQSELNPNYYHITKELPAGLNEYKFVNGLTWDEVEPVAAACATGPTGNRWVEVQPSDTVFELSYCWGRCASCQLTSVLFRVDMAETPIHPAGVHVAGDFQGWQGNTTPMADADGDGIWEALYSFDVAPGRRLESNHVTYQKDIALFESSDIHKLPVDLILLDCHDYPAQKAFVERILEDELLSPQGFIVLHDTGLHPSKAVVGATQWRRHWVHQPVERLLALWLANLGGWQRVSIHDDERKPFRHGLTIMQRTVDLRVPGSMETLVTSSKFNSITAEHLRAAGQRSEQNRVADRTTTGKRWRREDRSSPGADRLTQEEKDHAHHQITDEQRNAVAMRIG